MFALNKSTQQVVWSDFLGFGLSTSCSGNEGIVSTAAIAHDPVTGTPTVYVNAPDGYLYALDAATGNVEWRSVVGIPSQTQNDYYAWGSPAVANGKVYIGISSRCDKPLVPAGVLAFDQHSGDQLASWASEPSGVVGGSVWSSVGLLPDGDVVATTGNSQGTNQIPFGEALIVLDGSTLKLLDSWQVPKAQQVFDSDFGGSPTVFTARPNGVTTTMVGACNKNGYYYAFRANDVSAGPVWEDKIAQASGAGIGECDAAAIWNGKDLIEGGGSATTIDGTAYQGSVQSLDPTTGQPVWQTGLPGVIIGTPTEDGGGVIAAPVYHSSTGTTGVYLLSATNGSILKFISTAPAGNFAQPVFDGSQMLVGSVASQPLTAYALTTPGQSTPIQVSPASLTPGASVALSVTGVGNFTSPANVTVSGTAVQVNSVAVTSPTSATVNVTVANNAPAGAELRPDLGRTRSHRLLLHIVSDN